MGNGNRYSPGLTGKARTSSNPSWGTGTSALLIVPVRISLFQPLMGNGNLPPLLFLTSQKATGYREMAANAMLLEFGGRPLQQASRSNPNLQDAGIGFMAAILLPFRDPLGVSILAPRNDGEIVPVFRDQFEDPVAVRNQLVQLPPHLFERRPCDVAEKYRELLMPKIFNE